MGALSVRTKVLTRVGHLAEEIAYAGSYFLDLPSAYEVVVLSFSTDSFGGNGN